MPGPAETFGKGPTKRGVSSAGQSLSKRPQVRWQSITGRRPGRADGEEDVGVKRLEQGASQPLADLLEDQSTQLTGEAHSMLSGRRARPWPAFRGAHGCAHDGMLHAHDRRVVGLLQHRGCVYEGRFGKGQQHHQAAKLRNTGGRVVLARCKTMRQPAQPMDFAGRVRYRTVTIASTTNAAAHASTAVGAHASPPSVRSVGGGPGSTRD